MWAETYTETKTEEKIRIREGGTVRLGSNNKIRRELKRLAQGRTTSAAFN